MENMPGKSSDFIFTINLPNASKDLLIFAPSRNLAPLLPVTEPFSEPARSIMDNFATLTSDDKPEQRFFCLIRT